jgi:hypothetical protein
MPQQFAWCGAGTLPILKDQLAVNHDPAVSFGFLNPPPLASRDIMSNL